MVDIRLQADYTAHFAAILSAAEAQM